MNAGLTTRIFISLVILMALMNYRGSTNQYMAEIGKYPLLTYEQEVEHAALIAAGSLEARDSLIRSNLRLVVRIAHDFKGFGLALPDLISEGNIGLMRAAEKYDPAKGAKFSSYSSWWIKQSMKRALNNGARNIRVPVQTANKIRKIEAAKESLENILGREPTYAEIAERISFDVKLVEKLSVVAGPVMSLDDYLTGADQSSTFMNVVADESVSSGEDYVVGKESISRLFQYVDRLDEREQTIIGSRYGLDGSNPKTLEEVSKQIGRTRERVRQIQNYALKKLRVFMDEDVEYANRRSKSYNFGDLPNSQD